MATDTGTPLLTRETMANAGGERRSALDEEFLRQDCEQWTKSYWENETLGEQRVTFYVTLVTAALGALVALLTAEHFDRNLVRHLGAVALGVVLLVGCLTLLRIARRNRMKEEYLHRVTRIRRYFTGRAYAEFYGTVLAREPAWRRAGLAVLVSVLNAIVASVLIALLVFPAGLPATTTVALAVLFGSVIAQVLWIERDEGRTRTTIAKGAGPEPFSPWHEGC